MPGQFFTVIDMSGKIFVIHQGHDIAGPGSIDLKDFFAFKIVYSPVTLAQIRIRGAPTGKVETAAQKIRISLIQLVCLLFAEVIQIACNEVAPLCNTFD